MVLNTAGGYHGYWAADLNVIDPHLGSAGDLLTLVNKAHAMGMFVMLDVVANHMGCACASQCSPMCFDFAPLVPFNDSSHYHAPCLIADFTNATQVELCRLAGLPDLNQSVPFVTAALLAWVRTMVATYAFDGLRIDTVPEVGAAWWPAFVDAAGVFAVGEVDSGNTSYVAAFQGPGALPAVLNYPLFYALRAAFQLRQPLTALVAQQALTAQLFAAPALLATFADNHDNPRFLNATADLRLYANALTYVLTARGIPIVYYGSEQAFSGGNDPYCRESLWPHYNASAPLYALIARVLAAKAATNWTQYEPVDAAVDAAFYAFARGPSVLVALTNVGTGVSVARNVSLATLFPLGARFCNVFWPASDCFTLQEPQPIYLDSGESKVYIRQTT